MVLCLLTLFGPGAARASGERARAPIVRDIFLLLAVRKESLYRSQPHKSIIITHGIYGAHPIASRMGMAWVMARSPN